MNERRSRQIGAVTGLFTVAVSAGVLALLGSGLFHRPVLFAQAALLGGCGVAYLLGSVDALPTGPLAWYRWQGLGNVLVGSSLPLGFLGTGVANELFFFAVAAIGGLSLAAMGVDMLAFHGKYTRGERLDA